MDMKKIITTHILISLILGTVLGFVFIYTDDNGATNILAIPVANAVVFIGYGGPVIAGSAILHLISRWLRYVSQKVYIASYYILFVAGFMLLYTQQGEVDSGFGIFILPWLPLCSIALTLAVATFRRFYRSR